MQDYQDELAVALWELEHALWSRPGITGAAAAHRARRIAILQGTVTDLQEILGLWR